MLTVILMMMLTMPFPDSRRWCPTGDDPETAGRFEVQIVQCQLSQDSFTLTFRKQTTKAIDWDATNTEVAAALNALTTIGRVKVRPLWTGHRSRPAR
jgi:O-succinylbenzoate synthase